MPIRDGMLISCVLKGLVVAESHLKEMHKVVGQSPEKNECQQRCACEDLIKPQGSPACKHI